MKVVRYTFDVCLRDGIDKDTYSMVRPLEEAIMKCGDVCGCEHVPGADSRGYDSVDVDKAIEWQRANRRWIGERAGDGGK